LVLGVCVVCLLDCFVLFGLSFHAVYLMVSFSYGVPFGPFSFALITTEPGTQGYLDRKDRITVEVYAPGEQAMQVAQSVYASIVGPDIDTPSGYLDEVQADQTPYERPYQSDMLNRSEFRVVVTVRPV